jgi:hypothetical protein
MAAVLHSFEGILTILIIILTGFFLSKKGWFSDDSVSLISRLVTNVTLPTYMMSMLLASFTRDSLLQLVHGLPIPVLSMTIGYMHGASGGAAHPCASGPAGYLQLGLFPVQHYFYRPALNPGAL